jgi:plasmid stabilization system protein ParE
MSYALVVEPEAEAEIDAAWRWYELNKSGLGAAFLRAVNAALDAIKENPFQFQLVYGPVRRANIRRYPHGLMYRVLDREVIVLACFHGRRDPARWQEPTS